MIYDNGGSSNYDGIRIESNSDGNHISSNLLYDSAGTGYPINIVSGNNNYLVGNQINWSVVCTDCKRINDLGTNTKYTEKVKITLERAAVWTVNNGSALWTTTSPRSYLPVVGNGAPVTVNTIAAGKAIGDMLILEGTNDTNWVKIENTGNVKLSAVSHILGFDDVLTLIWNGTNWIELHWANNSPLTP